MDSVDKIRFFYEEGAVDDATGKLLVPKEKALNKVGHGPFGIVGNSTESPILALHWLHPTFRRFTFHERIKALYGLLAHKIL